MKEKKSGSAAGGPAAIARKKSHAFAAKKKEFENPFDKFANARKKHEVLNRRVKGEDRNVGRARKQAVEVRKSRLLQDYQTSKKSNTFADRRFGESDADLSLEDKMFLRFQKERVKKARNTSLFNLDSSENEVLTHKGQALGDGNMADADWRSDSDDEQGGLGKEIVNSLHFGGGMVEKKQQFAASIGNNAGDSKAADGDFDGDGTHKKSNNNRLDALQEIVMKSKMFKAQKKEAKEEQESERERLDRAFQDLISESQVKFRPTKRDRSEDKDEIGEQDSLMTEYDRSLRSMTFDTKAKPTDRTKSAEELAVDGRKKLEELEAARLRRMSANHDPEDDDAKEALSFKAKRRRDKAKNTTGDDDDDDEEDEDDGKVGGKGRGKGGKSQSKDAFSRKAPARMTDDEVDGSFGFGSSYLRENGGGGGGGKGDVPDYGDLTRRRKGKADNDEEEEEEDDEDDNSEEDEEGEDDDEGEWEEDEDVGPVGGAADNAEGGENDEEDVEDEKDEEEDEEDEDEDDSNMRKKVKGKGRQSSAGGDNSDDDDEQPRAVVKRIKKADKAIEQLAEEGVNQDMPHKLPCPANIDEFDEITDKYVKSAADFREVITRILAWNSVHLPGQDGTENRGRMHNFLDVLLKVFVRVGDSLGAAGAAAGAGATEEESGDGDGDKEYEKEVQEQLDFLCSTIFKLGQDIPDACAPLWGRTLKLMESQLQKRLRDFVQGTRSSSWPSLGQLLLFRLLGLVFSVSDFRHAIVSSASMLLCQCLTQCAVRTRRDLASGLLAASVLTGYTAEAGRLVPEVVEFLRSVLSLYIDPRTTAAKSPASTSSASASALASASATQSTLNSLVCPQRTFDLPSLELLRSSASSAVLPTASGAASGAASAAATTEGGSSSSSSSPSASRIPWSCFSKEKSSSSSDEPTEAAAASAASAAILSTAQTLLSALVTRHAKASAFPEIFAPTLLVLRSLRPQDKPSLPRPLQAAHLALLERMVTVTSERKTTRTPLQWRRKVTVSIEGKNPKFQVDYTFKKDMDPDSDRAKLKQLNKQVKREKKAAMRELRRDSEFIEQQKFKEQQEKLAEKREERGKNWAFMEEQQATLNLQVRKGGELLRGGGSGVAKKSRVKR